MRGITVSCIAVLAALLIALCPAAATAVCDETLPAPDANLVGFEPSIDAGGNGVVVYRIAVANWASYPAELFEDAADLPACGSGSYSARTWVDIYDDEDNSVLQSFCDLDLPEGLLDLAFTCIPQEAPVGVHVRLIDRRCGLSYTSEMVPIPPQ